MKIIEPSVEILEEENIYKKIEKAGRICYKSEDKITDTSYEKFIKMIIGRGHYSVLEHADITIGIKAWETFYELIPQYLKSQFIFYGKGSGIRVVHANVRAWREYLEGITIQEIIENYPLLFGDIELSPFNFNFGCNLSEDFSLSLKDNPYTIRETFVVTTTRDTSHQIVRHRVNSVSQESQRYCNYTKGKFSDVKFIMPNFIKNSNDQNVVEYWIGQRSEDEVEYNFYIKNGAAPEEARNCLPNATATSLVLTSSIWGWGHFLKLRLASDAQQEIRDIAKDIQEKLLNKYKNSALEPYLLP